MTLLSWPNTVPTHVRAEGYEALPPQTLLETEMERGHKLRAVATGAPEILTCPIRMTWAEFGAFQAWLDPVSGVNPGGSAQFNFPHPETQTLKRSQIVPQEGRPFTRRRLSGRNWLVILTLRVYPW